MKQAVIIPAYNEVDSIINVVFGVRKALEKLREIEFEIIVVDDGSTDGTDDLAKKAGATLKRHDENKGKGAASLTGWNYAKDQGFDYALIMDADGQHLSEDVLRFVRAAKETKADMVLPRRDFTTDMPFIRRTANNWQSLAVSVRTGKRIHDSQCGLRNISIKVLRKVLGKLKTTGFDLETEFLIIAKRYGFSHTEVGVSTVYIKGRKSRVNPAVDTFWYLWLLVRSLTWG